MKIGSEALTFDIVLQRHYWKSASSTFCHFYYFKEEFTNEAKGMDINQPQQCFLTEFTQQNSSH